jgi:hypothetical protein
MRLDWIHLAQDHCLVLINTAIITEKEGYVLDRLGEYWLEDSASWSFN